MRPWTVICIEDGVTKMIEVTAPFDQPAAHEYINEKMHREADVIAMIPGTYATRTAVFNPSKRIYKN